MAAMKTIGVIGGMSWQSSAVTYRLLNEAVARRLGGHHSAPVLLLSLDFAPIEAAQRAGDWGMLGDMLEKAAARLKAGGADIVLLATNTMHQVIDRVARAGVPVIHIVDPVVVALVAAGVTRPLLLGTRYTMEATFWGDRLRDRARIDAVTPGLEDRAAVHRIIYDELCHGTVRDESRAALRAIVERGQEAGSDAVILGCTELMLALRPDDVALPLFDSTALHAEAGVAFALGERAPLYRPESNEPTAPPRPADIRQGRGQTYLVPEQDQ